MSLRLESEWRQRALCSRVSPDGFFANGRPSRQQRAFCDDCPVRQECLDFALSSPWQPSGIWAGMSAGELEPLWAARHPGRGTAEIQEYLGVRSKW